MSKGFLLLASYRSGSTWFMDVLNHVEGMSAYSELFSAPEKEAGTQDLTREQANITTQYLDKTIRAYPHYYQKTAKRGIRPFSTFSYLDTFYEQERRNGFKLMYTQLARHPEIWAYVRFRGISIIHLVRQNHLDVIISREMRKATKTTHRVVGAQEVQPVQVILEPDKLVKQMKSLQRNIDLARRLIKVSRVHALEIFYEDLTRDSFSFDPVWRFLYIDSQNIEPQSRLVKLVRAGYTESIANYDEVRQALQSTEFAHLLEG
jgi:LPS sulfotransferase NodH